MVMLLNKGMPRLINLIFSAAYQRASLLLYARSNRLIHVIKTELGK